MNIPICFNRQITRQIGKCLFYIICFGLSTEMLGQMHTPLISNYGKDVHGGGTQNWAIASNDDGVLYVGNNSGVLVFNGQEWRIVELPNRTFVRSLCQSQSGHLFVGGQNEIGYFSNGKVSSEGYLSLSHLIPSDYSDFEDVWEIFDINGSIFFCTEKAVFVFADDKVNVVVPRGDRFENFFLYKNELCIQEIGEGLLICRDRELVNLISEEPVRFTRVSSIVNLTSTQDLVLTQEGPIFLFDGLSLNTFGGEAADFTQVYKDYTALRLHDGRIAIGTTQNGLIITNDQGLILNHYNTDSGLSNNTVLSIYQDRSENIWLGLDNGISYLEINSPFSIVNKINGIEGTGYAALRQGESYYFGTNLGLYEATEANESFELIPETKGQIWSLQNLSEGFIINRDGGAFYKFGESITRISDVRSSWKFHEIPGAEGYFIQGTYSGFYLYEKIDDEKMPLRLLGKMEGFDQSSRIFEVDADGYIWVSHAYRGLFRLKPNYEELLFEEIRQLGTDEGLPENLYITISEIRNEMVFATMDGIYSWNKSEGRFQTHEELSKLLGDGQSVQRLVEDDLGNIWFSTEDEFGLIEIRQRGVYNDVEVVYFNQIQDELVDGFEDVFTLSSEASFIPMEGGFYKYMLNRSGTPPEFEYPLQISEVYSTSESDSLLFSQSEPDSAASFVLPPKNGDIRFHFNQPTFGRLNQVSYQYILSGEDRDWSDWTTGSKKEYNNLAPGEYSFQVRARNGFGRISKTESFSFSVSPPWYSRSDAKVGFVILGFIIILTTVRIVSVREAKKTEEVKEQSRQTIEEKEREYQREKDKSESEIIRLRNEKLRSEVSHKNAELASTTMHLVQKSEMLQNIKKDLTELSKEGSDSMKRRVKQIQRLIEDDVRLDKNWERFETHFDQVHANFFKNLRAKHPELTPKDQKLCAYLRMNLATKEIAPLLNISVRGVEISRYRLRKKLQLDADVNLVSFIMEI